MIDRERFTQARHSCLEPDRSVGNVPVGELSLSSELECLSLQDSILPDEAETGKRRDQRSPEAQAPTKDLHSSHSLEGGRHPARFCEKEEKWPMLTTEAKGPILPIVVSALYFYPLKSCGGIALEVAEINQRGIRGDRALMVVDLAGRFITQREQPRLARIQPVIKKNGAIGITAPNMPEISLVVDNTGKHSTVEIWSNTCIGIDQGDAIAAWFSTFLGIACRIVSMPEDYVRRVDPQYATKPQDQIAFSDGYPLLLVTESSLADLNARMQEPLPMDRFRPNIVVKGTPPYVEDMWRKICIGQVAFHIVKACQRCPITTTDQATAVVGKEPLKTLATYRRAQKGVIFGQNLIHACEGTIRLGDTIEVIEKAATANFALRT